ncbi:hypothetical protein Daus18300_008699 [Diaporthe australafricana]|uniref:C3H1-type domain-containing protein n=1 Tax=Diaporthe australafricana TaxID=127596 RepID=A0ABR3WH79_9PEZI
MTPNLDHFIVRPDEKDGTPGPIVPLIAVDHLPDWIQLVGVPQELDAEQTIGMTNLGIVDKEDDSIYEVRLHHDKIRAILNGTDEKKGSSSSGSKKSKAKTTKSKKTASPAETKSKARKQPANEESLSTSTGSSSSTESMPVEKPQPRARPAERFLSASRHNVANTVVDTQTCSSNERPLRPHMTEAMRDEPRPTAHQHTTRQDKHPATVFCRHWCHHGSCKWGLECRYQHRMPTTLEGLREVGLKNFPTWYLLMMGGSSGVPGLFNMNTMLDVLGNGQSPAQYPATVQPALSQALMQQHHSLSPPQPSSHPSPMDLDLMRGRMSALLATGSAKSNRQKLKQIREMRQLLLHGTASAQQQQQQHRAHNYATLHTNASVAANAANIQRQAERQRQARNDLPVATRVRAREAVEDVLEGARDGGVLPGVGARNGRHGIVAGRDDIVEENLVDLD